MQALFSWSLVEFDYTYGPQKQRTTQPGNTVNTNMFANENRAFS